MAPCQEHSKMDSSVPWGWGQGGAGEKAFKILSNTERALFYSLSISILLKG